MTPNNTNHDTDSASVAAASVADAARALREGVTALRGHGVEVDALHRTLASLLVGIGLEPLLRAYRTAAPMSPEQFAEHWAIRDRTGTLRPRQPKPAPPLPNGLPDIPGWKRVNHDANRQANELNKTYRPPMPGSTQ